MMKKKLHKLITAFTAASLLLSMAPVTAAAEDDYFYEEGGFMDGDWDDGGWDGGDVLEGEGDWGEGDWGELTDGIEGEAGDWFDGENGGGGENAGETAGNEGSTGETRYASVDFSGLVVSRAKVQTAAGNPDLTGSSGAFSGTYVIKASARDLVKDLADAASAQGGGSITGADGGDAYVAAKIRFPDGVTVGSAETKNGLSSCRLEAESDYANTVTVRIIPGSQDASSFLSSYQSDTGEESGKSASVEISYSGDLGSGVSISDPSKCVKFVTPEEHTKIRVGSQPVQYSFDGSSRAVDAGEAEGGAPEEETGEEGFTEGEDGLADGDIFTDGEDGDIFTDGEDGDIFPDGEDGDIFPDGEDGDIITDGEDGDNITDGEDGIAWDDTDGPSEEDGTDTDPYNENDDDPYNEMKPNDGEDGDLPAEGDLDDADEEDGIIYDEDPSWEGDQVPEPNGTDSSSEDGSLKPGEGQTLVRYEFVSGTEGSELPETVLAKKPADEIADEGTEVKPKQPQEPDGENPYNVTEDGKWEFTGYDRESAVAEGEKIVFTGTWKFHKRNVYEVVNYAASATEGRELPDDFPVNEDFSTTGEEGTVLSTMPPEEETVETDDGVWTYSYTDPETVTLGEEETIEITYYYSFEGDETEEYEVSFVFESGTEEKDLPEEINELYLPESYMAENGDEITPESPVPEDDPYYYPEGDDGRWFFDGYDPESAVIDGEDVVFTGIWIYEEPEPGEYEVSFSFESGTEEALPEEINELYLPESYMAADGDEIRPESPVPEDDPYYYPEDGKGRWFFDGYDPEEAVIDGAPVSFTGLWLYEPKITYNVTSENKSATEGKEISPEIPVQEGFQYKGYPGMQLKPMDPPMEKVDTEDGVWTYSYTDPETVTLGEETEITVTYYYTFESKAKADVTLRYESAPKAGILPAELDKGKKYKEFVGTIVIAPDTPAKGDTWKDSSGTWIFTGFSPESLTVDKDSSKNVITGTWYLKEKPEETYPVAYTFKSGTEGRSLPDEVRVYTPSDSNLYKKGTKVSAKEPSAQSVRVSDGVWLFGGYVHNVLTVSSDVSKNVFVGVWTFKAAPLYSVKHRFVSASEGYSLPDAVKKLTPVDGNRYLDGTKVRPITPSESVVYVKKGAWRFEGYDKNSDIINGQDVLFTGYWKFTPNDVFKAVYKFVSGTEGYKLPKAVLAYLPEDPNRYNEGDVVAAIVPAKTKIADNNVIWTFRGYDENKKKVKNSDVVFTGTWTASRTNETVTVQFTKRWVDNGNSYGKRPQKVLITLYKNGGAYQTYTCTAPANSSDTWNYTVRDLPKYENGREISWTVDEAPVEGYSKSIRGMTITNTYGNRTQGARTEDRNPILLYAGIALAALGAVVLVLVLGLKKK